MIVQMISIFVLPWTGGPSDQSSGDDARKLIIAYTMIAQTTAKMNSEIHGREPVDEVDPARLPRRREWGAMG